MCQPLAYLEAMDRVASKNGAHPESFASILHASISFLENPETSVTHDVTCSKRVSPGQTVTCALPPSMRKTDLQEFTDHCIVSTAPDPDYIKSCTVTDGTKKGLENLLLSQRKYLISSSELANTMNVDGFSDTNAGLHFVSKPRMCQYTQSEKIGTATGPGKADLETNMVPWPDVVRPLHCT